MCNDKRYVVIDCDPGTDDVCAIMMMLAHQEFEVLGISPVCGNRPLAVCEENAKTILEFAGREDIPILKGAEKAMFREARTVSAKPGLDTELPKPALKVSEEYAWDFLYRMACKYEGQLEVMGLGPLTNIGIALTKYPDLSKKIKQFIIMGGAHGVGNHGTVPAEFNIWADPEGAKIVFNSDVPCVLMPYEICQQAEVEDRAVLALEQRSLFGKHCAEMIGHHGKGPDRELCDALCAAYMINPDMFECEKMHVDVETKGKLTEGKTVFTRRWTEHIKKEPNCLVGIRADKAAFTALVMDSMIKLEGMQK